MKKRLGRGLEALLGDAPAVAPPQAATPTTGAATAAVRRLPVAQLSPGKFQPRRRFAPAELSTLADSVRQHGILQPLLVRQTSDEKFEIIAGERRWRAAKMAGLASVPSVVREASDDESRMFALVENLQRADLNPIEQAAGLAQLTKQLQLTHAQAGGKVGLSRPAVSNLLRLLELAAPVQKRVTNGELDMGQARALLPLPAAAQVALAGEILRNRWTVRQTENQVRAMLAEKTSGRTASCGRKAKKQAVDPDTRRLEKTLSASLSARVEIRHKKTGGKISVYYSSLDILDDILKKLR